MVGPVSGPGVSPERLAAAWRVAHASPLAFADRPEECPTGTTLLAALSPGPALAFGPPDAPTTWRLALGTTRPPDRARALAQSLARALLALSDAEPLAPTPEVAGPPTPPAPDVSTEILPTVSPSPPPDAPLAAAPGGAPLHATAAVLPSRSDDSPRWRLGVAAGAVWQPALGAAPSRPGVELELRLAWPTAPLELALRAAWRPAVEAPSAAVPTELEALEGAALARWGLLAHPVTLHVGAGLALARDALTARPPTRIGPVTAADLGWTLPVELRLGAPLSATWALELSVTGRAHLSGGSRTWLGEAVTDAPRGSVEAAARVVGWWAP